MFPPKKEIVLFLVVFFLKRANLYKGMFWKPLVMHVYNTSIRVAPWGKIYVDGTTYDAETDSHQQIYDLPWSADPRRGLLIFKCGYDACPLEQVKSVLFLEWAVYEMSLPRV